MLCGETPFTGADEMKIANAILKGNFLFRRKFFQLETKNLYRDNLVFKVCRM
jgi:hypothetical protein